MDLNQAMSLMQSDDGLAQMMMEPAFDYGEESDFTFSQADLIRDMVNILRMDTKRLGQAAGVDISISQMTSERAAELLQGVAKGEAEAFIKVFDDIEAKRMRVLAELEDVESVVEYTEMKQGHLASVPDDAPVALPEFAEQAVEEDEDPTDED